MRSPYLSNPNILAHPDRIVQKVELDMTAQDSYLAGSPISAEGKLANDASAIGILLYDVHKAIGGRTGVVVIFGRIKQDVAAEHSGITISAEAKAALIDITFTGDGCRMGGGGLTELPEGYPYKETRVTVDMSALFGADGAVLCKVSDNIPESLEQGAQLKTWRNGESGNVLVTIANDNYLMASEAMVFVSFADNITFDDFGVPVSVPEKGVYFLHVPGMLTVTGVAWDSNATQPDITWDGVVETIHTMAPEFLPAGVGGGVQVVEITESKVDGETVRTSSHTAAEIVEMAETSAVVGKLVALDGTVIVCALSNTFAVPSFGINAAYFWYILSVSDGSAILKFLEVGADKNVKMYSATIGS